MAAVWRLGEAKVDDVRREQSAGQSAYTTIQTVMNRLAERGVLVREKQGDAYVYRARYDMSGGMPRAGRALEHSARLLAVVMAGLTLAAFAALPAWAVARSFEDSSPAHSALVCRH